MNSAYVSFTHVLHFVILHGINDLQKLSVVVKEKSRNILFDSNYTNLNSLPRSSMSINIIIIIIIIIIIWRIQRTKK
jgi:hypothetical protein